MIAPWDLEPGHDLEEWVEAAEALTELSSVKNRKKAQAAAFEKMRRNHPHYGPMHYRKH